MRDDQQYLEIPLSKLKMSLLLLAGLLFVAAGIWCMIEPDMFKRRGSPVVTFLLGTVCSIFFGACSVNIFIKLWDKKPGLILDEIGLINNTGLSTDRVLWSEIENIETFNVNRQRMVLLKMKNPKAFVKNQPTGFRRKLAKMSISMSGAPYGITSNGLKISFDELYTLLQKRLEASRITGSK